MTLAIRTFFKMLFKKKIFFFLLIHSCKTIYNIVLILQVILQDTQKIREDAENTPSVHLYCTTEITALGGHLSYPVIYSIESIAWLLYSSTGYSKRFIGY